MGVVRARVSAADKARVRAKVMVAVRVKVGAARAVVVAKAAARAVAGRAKVAVVGKGASFARVAASARGAVPVVAVATVAAMIFKARVGDRVSRGSVRPRTRPTTTRARLRSSR